MCWHAHGHRGQACSDGCWDEGAGWQQQGQGAWPEGCYQPVVLLGQESQAAVAVAATIAIAAGAILLLLLLGVEPCEHVQVTDVQDEWVVRGTPLGCIHCCNCCCQEAVGCKAVNSFCGDGDRLA